MQHRDDDEWLLVRARTQNDLLNLQTAIAELGWGADATGSVIDDPRADYRWRLVVYRPAYADYLAAAATNLDYTTNVKGNLDQGDQLRHSAMLDCWHGMRRLQRRGSELRGPDPVAEWWDEVPANYGELDLRLDLDREEHRPWMT